MGQTTLIDGVYEEEFTGLYGSSSISETVLQMVWLKSDFIRQNLLTVHGKSLEIIDAGTWNRLEGPDFKDAKILIDGELLQGDVEIHFYAQDWFGHGHHLDNNYANVILHVVLFEPDMSKVPAHNNFGYCPETLVLLDKLNCGLEEYAAEEALKALNDRQTLSAMEGFLELPLDDQFVKLEENAQKRWQEKLVFAERRLAKFSFHQACHLTTLEVLGYKRNRQVMGDIGLRYGIEDFKQKGIEEIYEEFKDRWTLRGLRPANQPKKRLEQYANLAKLRPDYAERISQFSKQLPNGEKSLASTRTFRRIQGLQELRSHFQSAIFADQITSTRLDTLIVDGILPLISLESKKDLFLLWYHWFAGDITTKVTDTLRASKVKFEASNGLQQGMLKLIISYGLC